MIVIVLGTFSAANEWEIGRIPYAIMTTTGNPALSHQSKRRDPDLVADFAKQLETLIHKTRAGELPLCFLDESGFSQNPQL